MNKNIKTNRNKRTSRVNNKQKVGKRIKAGKKTMKCSPIVKGQTPINDSCFTIPVLNKLKNSYNKHHPIDKITVNEPTEIWVQLKSRFSKCHKEDCWLNVIEDPNEREKLDDYLFAPDSPDEWKKDPNAWLSNYDIFEVLHQYEIKYKTFRIIGPTPIDFDSKPNDSKCVWQDLCDFSLDKFIESGKRKLGVVFNLSKSKDPGSHWVSLYVDLDDKFIFFFDSAGDKIPIEISRLVDRIQEQAIKLLRCKMDYYDNNGVEHQMGNTECGMYSLYFIITMLTGETEGKGLSNCKDKIKFFMKKRIPDQYVSKYRKIYFNS